MRNPRAAFLPFWAWGSCLALAILGACDDATAPGTISIDSTLVSSDGVDPPGDRTYEFDRSAVRPDSALRGLWSAGLEAKAAWRPVDYACLDARGARLTVELREPDARMAAHGYTLGTGRLSCATTLVRYSVLVRR